MTNRGVSPPTVNVTSYFYYNYDQLQTQVISYPEQCIPLYGDAYKYPCSLYFNPNGIYLAQPMYLNVQCCLLFPGVGAVPPNFLAAFTYNGTAIAQDYYNDTYECNYWVGDGGFAYWTDVKQGHDIYFQDGPTGTYWSWGRFTVAPQDPIFFALPGSAEECNQPCPPLPPSDQADPSKIKDVLMAADPMIKLAFLHAQTLG